VIVGRDSELRRIDALIDAARRGLGGALVVRGEAGIGKTALLAAARERAADVRVLAASGVEIEAHLPFAALAQLIDPVLDRRDRLPAPQTAALAGALALGPPAPGDRFAVCVATLGLMQAAAEDVPVLALVDDAHWLDPASAECLGFAARRLGGTRVALLLAIRDPERAAPGIEEIPDLEATPLLETDARRLLAATAPDLAAGVRDAVVAAAAGNPLALIEVAAQLTPAERAGRAPLPEPLRPTGRLGAVFERRVAALPPDAREALVVAAAAGGGDVATIWQACRALGVDERALEAAEAQGLLRLASGRLAFAHPLVRSAAYHGASRPRRRAVHRALADAIQGDRRAWHLAAAAAGPDEEAARALQDAGAAAAARRGYAEAATAYERAAELSPEPDDRARRLRRASGARVVVGHLERSLALLDEIAALGTPTAQDPRLVHMRSLLLIGTGQFAAGFAMLKALAEAAAGVADPTMAAFLHADAAMAALIAGDCRETLALAERAAALLGDADDPRARAHVVSALSAGRVFGRQAAAARADLDRTRALLVQLDPLDWTVGLRIHALAIHLCNALEEYEQARAIAGAALAVLEDAGAVGARANPLSHAADAAYRLGEWDVAWRETAEAIALADETRADETLVRGLVHRARLLAARGFEAEAREHAERALTIAERSGIGTIAPYVRAALAFLDLGLGRVDAVIARLEGFGEVVATVHGMVHPSIIPWRPDLCEAYVMAGRLDDARREAAVIADEAEAVGGTAGRAMAARCEGVVATAFDEPFERALALDRMRPMPFERARTLLAYGARLRRARRRAEARRVLHEAEEIFVALAAAPWGDRVAAELRAAGAVRRPPRAAARDELTAQETRVAAALARGLTIREAASELFLSPKTVDFHLQQVYGKLAIRSRAELAVVAVERGWI
jgi:DNA-binding CsgD family transcriptional regulator/tetratricopeptide (TPR) repeat protein